MFWSNGANLGRNLLAASALRRASSYSVIPLSRNASAATERITSAPCERLRPRTRVISSRPSSGIPEERSSAMISAASRSSSL